MSNSRRRLPDRRVGMTFDFQHSYPGGQPLNFTASTGHYASTDASRLGEVGEVFVALVNGSDKMSVDAHDAAILISFALQYGAQLAEMGKACVRGEDGVAHGFMGSLIDTLMKIRSEMGCS